MAGPSELPLIYSVFRDFIFVLKRSCRTVTTAKTVRIMSLMTGTLTTLFDCGLKKDRNV